ncbi:hypothetical protein OROMI_012445 [Orobanche minor]
MVTDIMIQPKKKRSFICSCLPIAILISAVFFIGSSFLVTDYKERVLGCNLFPFKATKPKICENECRPDGTETLPRGIVSKTTDLEMRPLWGPPKTKWWFAKRFLHPNVVAQYAYIFLWDEDLGVENFHAGRYLSVIQEGGLEISQPAIDANKSEVHYILTTREISSKVHRRAINFRGPGRRCYEDSMEPPCTGFVEMMAPVFSTASWRCAWYMIQLGYCAQGNRTVNIGIVDSEYVIHLGLPTLGGSAGTKVTSTLVQSDDRNAVRKESFKRLPEKTSVG